MHPCSIRKPPQKVSLLSKHDIYKASVWDQIFQNLARFLTKSAKVSSNVSENVDV